MIIKNEVMKKMVPTRYPRTLSAKLTDEQRDAIDSIAESQKVSIGEAVRVVIDAGLRVLHEEM